PGPPHENDGGEQLGSHCAEHTPILSELQTTSAASGARTMLTASRAASPIRRRHREPDEDVDAMATQRPPRYQISRHCADRVEPNFKVLAPETGERPSRLLDEVSQRGNRNGVRFDGHEARRVEIEMHVLYDHLPIPDCEGKMLIDDPARIVCKSSE